MNTFKDKVAFVTGGASGIGRALCMELGKREAIVVAADIDEQGAKEVAASITSNGGRAKAYHLDVTKAEDIQKLIDETYSEYGRLDFMFNNAGIAIFGEVRDAQLDHWINLININQVGVIQGTLAAYEKMIEQGTGHIVNTASISGLTPYPICVPYTITKHAVVGLTTSLRLEAAGLGVKVSVVCPGPIQTNIANSATRLHTQSTEDIFAKAFTMGMDTQKAAKIILRGVKRNKAIIVFPFHAKFAWWLYRIHPALATPMGRAMVKGFRKFVRGNQS